MVHEFLLTTTQRAFGSHPSHVFSVCYELPSPFHNWISASHRGSRASLRNKEIGTRANATAFSAVAFVVAGSGFEPPTFGLCDLTHLSMRVGLYLHPRGMLAIQSLPSPTIPGAWFGIAHCPIVRAT